MATYSSPSPPALQHQPPSLRFFSNWIFICLQIATPLLLITLIMTRLRRLKSMMFFYCHKAPAYDPMLKTTLVGTAQLLFLER